MITNALISVSDKTGIVAFCRRLSALGVNLISTGGTAKSLREAGLQVQEVADLTGFPEMLDGRVKTLHPAVHAGLLAKRSAPAHMKSLADHQLPTIDLVVINFYPFEKTVENPTCTLEAAVEQIDIGGPAMVRSAAKNYADVAVVTDPQDYDSVLAELQSMSVEARFRLAKKAFACVARYDAAIANYLGRCETLAGPSTNFPETIAIVADRIQALRYGENPHQPAAWYRSGPSGPSSPGLSGATQLQGKELSYNNILDADAALEMISAFSDRNACVIVKHTNPCGVGLGGSAAAAYARAVESDPVSHFGGIVAFSQPLDAATAERMVDAFYEVILAPEFSEAALRCLQTKKNLRLLQVSLPVQVGVQCRSVAGGILVQEGDTGFHNIREFRVVSTRLPTDVEYGALDVAWRLCKMVKSNAIVLANATGLVGVGAGQMSRVDAVRLAVQKSVLPVKGSVLASDGFFPFADGVELACEAGVSAIVQPGGSVRDDEVIAAVNVHQCAMILSGLRHFRH